MKYLYSVFFGLLIACILSHSRLSMAYASLGLSLWFEKMIPALLPFMILSGLMVRMHLIKLFTKIIYPVINPIYHVSHAVCYGMFMGFLCGFPMGAKTTVELLENQEISEQEANYLLSFCNNIGPVYYISYALPTLERQMKIPYLLGMYGLPLVYGFVLRYTLFRKMTCKIHEKTTKIHFSDNIFEQLDITINSSLQSILMLGGYMIIFNLINILPHLICGYSNGLIAQIMEISGGLKISGNKTPFFSLCALSFGGLSCLAQTNSCIRETRLSIKTYLIHKLVITSMMIGYLCVWRVVFPKVFLA